MISNFPSRMISAVLRAMVFPLGRPYVVPSDKLGHEVARLLIEPSATRDRLTAGMYLPEDEGDALGAIELALAATLAAEPIEARMRDASRPARFGAAPAPIAPPPRVGAGRDHRRRAHECCGAPASSPIGSSASTILRRTWVRPSCKPSTGVRPASAPRSQGRRSMKRTRTGSGDATTRPR